MMVRGKYLLVLFLALVGAVKANILHTSSTQTDIEDRVLKRTSMNGRATQSDDTVTTFCLIADAPYTEYQRVKMNRQVQNMDSECEFVVHLGDIRDGAYYDDCIEETYSNASRIMKRSDKPVIMVMGDNEYNDCGNPSEGLGYWHDAFDGFLQEHWPDNDLDVSSQSGRIENVFFIRKQTLFIALNLVGGRIHDADEWDERLTGNFQWTKSLIEEHVFAEREANLVVVMGHADNFANTRPFFNNMRDYIENELENAVPILHLNGDNHYWAYQSNYLGQSNWLRITVDGETKKPPLMVTVDSSQSDINDAVSYYRG
jgi:predicted phosphodiesterase